MSDEHKIILPYGVTTIPAVYRERGPLGVVEVTSHADVMVSAWREAGEPLLALRWQSGPPDPRVHHKLVMTLQGWP
jgi:hypothetical protein